MTATFTETPKTQQPSSDTTKRRTRGREPKPPIAPSPDVPIAHVILKDQFYSYDDVAELVEGIGRAEFEAVPWIEYKLRGGARRAYSGRRIAGWLENCGSDWQYTDSAHELIAVRRRAKVIPDNSPEPEGVQPQPAADLVANLRREKEQREKREAEKSDRERAKLFVEYLSVLNRDAGGEAKNTDPKTILDIAEELGLTIDDVEKDGQFVRRVIKLQERAANRSEKESRRKKALAAARKVEEQFNEAIRAARSEQAAADAEFKMCSDANAELNRMGTQRPEIFTGLASS